jgi:hypothetical protein
VGEFLLLSEPLLSGRNFLTAAIMQFMNSRTARVLSCGCSLAVFSILAVAADLPVDGNLSVTQNAEVDGSLSVGGSADIGGDTLSIGTRSDSAVIPGLSLLYGDASAPTIYFSSTRNDASWLWRENGTKTQMKLGADNKFQLFDQAATPVAKITLDPLGTSIFSTPVTFLSSSNLTIQGAVSLDNGSITTDGEGGMSVVVLYSDYIVARDIISPNGNWELNSHDGSVWGQIIGGGTFYAYGDGFVGQAGDSISNVDTGLWSFGDAGISSDGGHIYTDGYGSLTVSGSGTITTGNLQTFYLMVSGASYLDGGGIYSDGSGSMSVGGSFHAGGVVEAAAGIISKGAIRVPESGDLSMGGFTAGTNPAQ